MRYDRQHGCASTVRLHLPRPFHGCGVWCCGLPFSLVLADSYQINPRGAVRCRFVYGIGCSWLRRIR